MKTALFASGVAFSFLLAGCAPAIVRAANNGETETVRNLLAQGADPNAVSTSGPLCCGSALLYASEKGNVELVNLLIDKGAYVNLSNYHIIPGVNSYFSTALMAAADAGQDLVVKILLQKGADIKAANTEGDTALTLAQRKGHESTVRLLQEWRDKAKPPMSSSSPASESQAGSSRGVSAGAEKPWWSK